MGIGTIKIKMFDGIVRTLGDVRYIPDLKKNLISLGTLDSIDCSISIKGGVMKVSKGAMVIMKGQKTGNLYKLMGKTVIGGASVSTHAGSSNDNSELWHKRLGHLSEGGMLELHKRKLLQGVKSCKLDFCKFCVFGKQKRVSFKAASHTSKGVLDYVHSDVWGPIRHISNGGARYFVTFIDDFSRKTGKKLKYFGSDNGMEYKDEEFLQFCKDKGIIRHFSVKRTPEQNGVAERMNKTLLERARCMRLNADLPKSFWAEAVNTACYLINRSPSSAINHRVPEEVWSGKQVNFSAMKFFGCPAYVHLHNEERSKLDPKSKECIFLGYEEGVKGYRLWDPVAKKKVISRDVVFNEAHMLNTNATSSERQGHTVEIELHEQRTKSTDESTDGSTDELSLEDPEEHPSDSWNLSKFHILHLKKLLSRDFDMKDLGSAKKIFGMEIHRDRKAGKLWVTQKSYVEKVLERFSMLNAKPVSTPLGAHFQLSSQLCPGTKEDVEYMSRVPYANAVGCLMYAMVCTRPDISHAVSMVSRYMGNPGKKHWDAVKWIFRYLAGSTNFGVMFDCDGTKGEVSGFVDSDYAGDLDSRRSTTGYIFIFYGGPICWKSVLQSTTALPTTEAEYMALTEAAKEALWLKGLVEELGFKQRGVLLQCESQSALDLAKNQARESLGLMLVWEYSRLEKLFECSSVEPERSLREKGVKKGMGDAWLHQIWLGFALSTKILLHAVKRDFPRLSALELKNLQDDEQVHGEETILKARTGVWSMPLLAAATAAVAIRRPPVNLLVRHLCSSIEAYLRIILSFPPGHFLTSVKLQLALKGLYRAESEPDRRVPGSKLKVGIYVAAQSQNSVFLV
ncbi:hypothetical protein RJ639_025454 [Escallonia herrerae]|uniref:Integrase catalytic domain-containing protein n=1 Tax=Escallonia herrerae TaxID=1293975 RepID=A0AA89ABC4_9ASTE|nr:hypothetical protein RJ639_025454 [Escallonia herrerae]